VSRRVFLDAERRTMRARVLRSFFEWNRSLVKGEEEQARAFWAGIGAMQEALYPGFAIFNRHELWRFEKAEPREIALDLLSENNRQRLGPELPTPPSPEKLHGVIRRHVAEHGTSPTMREMQEGVGWWGRRLIYRFLHQLIAEGKIEQVDRFDHPASPAPRPAPDRVTVSAMIVMTGLPRKALAARALAESWPKKDGPRGEARYLTASLPADIRHAIDAYMLDQARARVGLPPVAKAAQ